MAATCLPRWVEALFVGTSACAQVLLVLLVHDTEQALFVVGSPTADMLLAC